jgi:hypothetical protein
MNLQRCVSWKSTELHEQPSTHWTWLTCLQLQLDIYIPSS